MERGRWLRGALACLGMLLIAPAVLLTSFEAGALNRSHHQALYESLGAAQAAGVDGETLSAIGDMLVEYLNEERGDLGMTAEVNGAVQPVFNAREIAHMRDVRALFALARRLAAVLMGLGAALLAAGLAGRGWAKRLLWAGVSGQAFWLALLVLTAFWAAADFSGAFQRFHGLFFTNDLWQLNPETDLMIRMLPEKFFEAMAARAAGRVLIGQAILAGLWGLPVAVARR
jgi:integral membrane protein (TIGR01906 family)